MGKKDAQNIKNQEQEVLEDNTVQETVNDTEKQEVEVSETEALENEVSSLKDQNLRLYAEFENFRKRTSKERVELFGTANQELMSALLPIMDDFQRALKNLEDSDARDGVNLIFNKFESTLKNKGLKPMESTVGKSFDVDTMEAITRIPAPEDKLKGKVVDEIEPGYELGSKILRYAKVVVGE
jgi:molecular chaperone GrpE